jgi:hypothetical protein
MSLPLLPIIIEAVPLILGALSVGVGFKSLRSRFTAEDTLVKEIESNKKEIEKEYVKYLKAETSEEKLVELDEIRRKIKILLEHTGKENSSLIIPALLQSSVKGRNSYLKKLLSEAHISGVETANKQKQPDA